MPTPPSADEMARIARSLNLDLTSSEVEEYTAAMTAVLDSHRRLDELADNPRRVDPPRTPGYRPSAEDNPHRGWVWRCSITGEATGPLSGKHVAIKDNTAVAGVPMLNGTPLLEGYVPQEDATVVQRLLSGGAEITGKTAVPALCFDGAGITCYPEQPRNPHDPTRAPGGSSAGSAIVVTHGEADLALGGDQGGSVRLPASWSGCCGHKPTYGLVPYTGAFPIERTLDHLGPMASTVAECAQMLEVIAGYDGADPRQTNTTAQQYTRALDSVDVLIMPTTPMKALEIPDAAGAADIVRLALGTNLHNTAPFNVTGHPALSVPCGSAEGLPIGLQIVGRHSDDATVLRIGHAYEQLRGPLPAPAAQPRR